MSLFQTSAVVSGLVLTVVFTASHSTMLNLARDSQGRLPFAPSAVVLAQEALKAAVCAILLLLRPLWRRQSEKGGRTGLLSSSVSEPAAAPDAPLWWPRRDLLYTVPALCYAINNNLAVTLQDEMDPATFQVLCNLKTVTTALFYGLFFSPRRIWEKKEALFLLLAAGIVNSYGGMRRTREQGWAERRQFLTPMGLGVMLVYCMISGFAGVYTELVFKRYEREPFFSQGLKLYAAGIALNAFQAWNQGVFAQGDLWRGFGGWVIAVIITQAANGLLYGAVMKFANSLVRLFIVAIAMLLASVLARWQLGYSPSPHLIVAACLVTCGLYFYSAAGPASCVSMARRASRMLPRSLYPASAVALSPHARQGYHTTHTL